MRMFASLFLLFVTMSLFLGTTPVLAEESASSEATDWISLFNGKDLDGWKTPTFGGEGPITVENGMISIGTGAMVTGLAYAKEFPFTSNYEIEVVAMRTSGGDFFSAITFPIGEGFATFVNGGWGGGVFGISCIDGFDASENDTMQLLSTRNDVWYTYLVRVTDSRVQCFVDGKEIINRERDGSKFTTRFEVECTEPLGIANYCSESLIKSIRYRAY